jgi:hypothetical protein
VSPDDPDIKALARSIKAIGLKEPIVVTTDGFILSGHRRHVACRLAGLREVPCRVEAISRLDPNFERMLCEYNRQRVKTFAEVVREQVVTVNPAAAYTALIEHRKAASAVSGEFLDLGEKKRRKRISRLKWPLLEAIVKVVYDLRDWWPISDRTVHYHLLNNPPLRNASRPESVYINDVKSYHDTTDVLTRARLEGLIPFAAIDDPTREVETWVVDRDISGFVGRELDGFLTLYWRDLQQSQPNQIEVVGEKLTVKGAVRSVCMRYCVPYTIGRGYCSIPARHQMSERFKKSGKQKLVVLCVSDFDPDGEEIATSFSRSMRDDFHIDVLAKKVCLTEQQVKERDLPKTFDVPKSKKDRPLYKKFVAKYGDNLHELEALPPDEQAGLLEDALDSVMDLNRFNREVDAEKEDAARLDTIRATIMPLIAEATRKSN